MSHQPTPIIGIGPLDPLPPGKGYRRNLVRPYLIENYHYRVIAESEIFKIPEMAYFRDWLIYIILKNSQHNRLSETTQPGQPESQSVDVIACPDAVVGTPAKARRRGKSDTSRSTTPLP